MKSLSELRTKVHVVKIARTAWSSACLACGVVVHSGRCVSSRTVASFSSNPSYNVVGSALDAMSLTLGRFGSLRNCLT